MDTITVCGVELTPTQTTTSGASWCGDVGGSRLMVFGPAWSQRNQTARAWAVLLTTKVGDAQIQLHGAGDTQEAALDALRSALNAVTKARETIGTDLAAMLDAREGIAVQEMLECDPRYCEICGQRAQPMGTEARCLKHDNERMER